MTDALQRLVDDGAATANDIIAATDNLADIADAARSVFADVVRLDDAAQTVVEESETMLARLQAADIAQFNAMVEASDAAQQRAIEATEALREAWEKYAPWHEALDRVEVAIAISLRGSLGRGKTWQTAT